MPGVDGYGGVVGPGWVWGVGDGRVEFVDYGVAARVGVAMEFYGCHGRNAGSEWLWWVWGCWWYGC